MRQYDSIKRHPEWQLDSHHENLPMVKFKSRHISCHCVALVWPDMLCAQHKRGVKQGSILSLHILKQYYIQTTVEVALTSYKTVTYL